jgi:tyrosyl-tRNA synthetase
MDALLSPSSSKLGKDFELRKTASGATVVVKKTEKWSAATPKKEESQSSAAAPHSSAAAPPQPPAAAGAGAAAPVVAAPKTYKVSEHDLDTRFKLCRSVGEECIQEEELVALLKARPHPVCYDGFEPSGRMHIAQGIFKAILVNKLTAAGCVFKFWVADWFALLNNKMGGDLKKIRTVGRYMIEVWKAAGMDMTNVEFLWASDEINARANDYWLKVMDIARKFSVPRITRCCTIMGRKEGEELSAAQIFYPCMQAADIFFLKADICQLGMDQRKVNMLAREYCDVAEPKIKFKPVILSHHMMAGLKEGQEKMSKSDPDSAIFMEDSAEDVKRKIKQVRRRWNHHTSRRCRRNRPKWIHKRLLVCTS